MLQSRHPLWSTCPSAVEGHSGCIWLGIFYKTSGCGHLCLTFRLASLGNLLMGRSAGSWGRGHPAPVATEPVSTPPAAGERLGSVQLHLLPLLLLSVGGLHLPVHCYRFVVLIHISTFSQVLCWTYLLQPLLQSIACLLTPWMVFW